MQTITPFLWFDDKAEEAARFHTSIFRNSQITATRHFAEGSPRPKGSVMSVTFSLDGQELIALNGGPHYSITPAFSLFARCQTQAEVDHLWEKLCDGGEPVRCGWLRDRYGLSRQIVPIVLGEMLQDKDPEKSGRVMQAMLKMIKLDIATLQRAYNGEPK